MIYDRPWSEVGIDVAGQDLSVALTEAGFNFNVSVVQGKFTGKDNNIIQPSGYFYIIRDDTEQVLGQCKGRFVPVQNNVLVDIAQPFIDRGDAVLDTLGLFGNGEKIWVLLKLTGRQFEVSAGDMVSYYLLLINGHDASTSVQMGIIPFRINCTNMLSKIGGNMLRVKHTENAAEMLVTFQKMLESQISLLPEFATQMRLLAKTSCVDPGPYFKSVFKLSESSRATNILIRLLELFSDGRGQNGQTWWSAFNAVTEYLNYEAGRNQESRLNSLWFGANEKVNALALKLALEACNESVTTT